MIGEDPGEQIRDDIEQTREVNNFKRVGEKRFKPRKDHGICMALKKKVAKSAMIGEKREFGVK